MKMAYSNCSINVSHDDDNDNGGVGGKDDNFRENLSFAVFVGLLTSFGKVPLYKYRSWDRRLIVEAFIGDMQLFS